MSLKDEALNYHRNNPPGNGKLEVVAKTPVRNLHELALAYTPGVAEPSKIISRDASKIYDYTVKGNLVAVVSDGSSVLGLGNVGAYAAVPVMEGKAILFKMLAGVDAFPICLSTNKPEEVVETVKRIAPIFGGINLEDIGAPSCFEIEAQLKKELDIPVFHDDQHGTAVVVLAGLINALKVVDKKLGEVRVVINGAGAAGLAVSKFLVKAGVKNLTVCDSKGAIYEGRPYNMNPYKEEVAHFTNIERREGKLSDIIKDADVFIGLSVAGVLTLSATKVGRFLLLAHREPSKQWVCHHPVNTPFPQRERRLCWHPHGGCVLFSPLKPKPNPSATNNYLYTILSNKLSGDSSRHYVPR